MSKSHFKAFASKEKSLSHNLKHISNQIQDLDSDEDEDDQYEADNNGRQHRARQHDAPWHNSFHFT
jgi:hypothetical protein